MRLRNRHLACLLLLLSSLSAADASGLRSGHLTLGGRYISMLLSQSAAAGIAARPLAQHTSSYKAEDFLLAPAHHTLHTAVWTMRPPSEHTAALHTVTSSLS